ncbi:2'-5' RNA ligase family protein [Pseudonocardia spinosispora]|uniref:2'-5' RNA ligase family protein n=1 Tax=Pseudonocardia spinosispora TaxID=103441 RepID=UPI00040BE9CF|nr:2'-5' RNA ligase family protein [Pseudonocardia spinosispora]
MYPLPAHMRDRWANRWEPQEGRGTVYWHALMARYPKAREAAGTTQAILAGFDGFHLTPCDWLHMTMLVAGATEEMPRDRLSHLLDATRSALGDVSAPAVALQHVLYHPEAILLAVEPAEPLREIRRQIDSATCSLTGGEVDDEATAKWVPHMTVGYSTANQPAAPIIDALGTSIPAHRFVVEAVTLVVQWGPERRWDWEPVGSVEFSSARAPMGS